MPEVSYPLQVLEGNDGRKVRPALSIAILLPSLKKARDQVRTLVRRSNLNQ